MSNIAELPWHVVHICDLIWILEWKMRQSRRFHRISVVGSKDICWMSPWSMQFRCDGEVSLSSAALLRHGLQYSTLCYMHIADVPVTATIITTLILESMRYILIPTLIARSMGPKWATSGADRTQVGPMLVPWTLLSEYIQAKIYYRP